MSTYPLTLKPGVILIRATVVGTKGINSIRLILDTGATYTLIDPDILIECGYDPVREPVKRPIITASGIEYCPFMRIKALEALGYTMKNMDVCAHSLPPNLPARGLLGLNFLSHFNLHLRFLDKIMEISR